MVAPAALNTIPLLGVGEAAYAYVGGFMGSRAHGAAERAAYG